MQEVSVPVAEAALSSPSTAFPGGSVSVAVQQIRAASRFYLLSPVPSAYPTALKTVLRLQ